MEPEVSGLTALASTEVAADAARPRYAPDDVLNEHEAARALRYSVSTLRRFRQTGDGPVYIQLSPGRIGYQYSDLLADIAARKIRNTAQGDRIAGRAPDTSALTSRSSAGE